MRMWNRGRAAVLVVAAAVSGAWGGSARDELVALRAKLASQRLIGRSSGWAAELSFAKAHKKDAALAAEVMYDVGVSQRERDSSQAATTFAALLEAHPEVQPWAALAAYELAREQADHSSTRAKAIASYETFLTSKHPDPLRNAQAVLSLGRLYQAAAKPAEAAARYQAFLAQFPDDVRGCAEALAALGVLAVEQKEPARAYATYGTLKKRYPWAVEARRGLLLAIAQAFRTADDREAAIEVHEKLLADLPAADPRRVQVYTGLAMLHAQAKDTDAAVATYRRMAADPGVTGSYRSSAYRQLFALRRTSGDHAAIVSLAYEVVAAQPSAAMQSGNVFGELVNALINEGRVDEALGMAKACYHLSGITPAAYSSSSSRQEAIFAVVRAVKAKEGSLVSANAFIAYIEQGPNGADGHAGTKDDRKDPLAAFHLPPEPGRDRMFAEAAKRFITQPKELGYLYVCWDRPADALRAFRRHYLATSETTSLQAAATQLARVMRALGRPESEVTAFFDFQNYGPNGKDGKPKTKDDLKDPILALPRVQPK